MFMQTAIQHIEGPGVMIKIAWNRGFVTRSDIQISNIGPMHLYQGGGGGVDNKKSTISILS